MQDVITEKREEIAELCRLYHVRRLSVFGSAVRDDFDPAKSDVDVIAEFDDMPIKIYAKNKWSFQDELVSRLNRKVWTILVTNVGPLKQVVERLLKRADTGE